MSIYVKVQQVNIGSFKCKPDDKLRINITASPVQHAEDFIFEAKDSLKVNHVWSFDHSCRQLEKLLFTLRKKSFLESDPIIGRFIIDLYKIPENRVIPLILNLEYHEKRANNGQMRLEVHFVTNGSPPFTGPRGVPADLNSG